MLRKPEGGQHFRGYGGFHRRHCILDEGLISYPSSPLEVPDSRRVSRQLAQLLHPGTHTHSPQGVFTTQVDATLDPLELLSLSSQACNNLEIGKVTGDGLIKGHAYAITDTHKASITQRQRCRLCSTWLLLSLFIVASSSVCLLLVFLYLLCFCNDQFLHKDLVI